MGVCEVDTRALTRHLRERGAMRAGIFSGQALPARTDDAAGPSRAAVDICLDAVRREPRMAGQALAAEVTTPEGYVQESSRSSPSASRASICVTPSPPAPSSPPTPRCPRICAISSRP